MAVILVADDEETIRALISLVLKSSGHEVLTAANGLEAVALFRSYRSHIDAVITDLNMPVMDGYELVRMIRHDRPDARILCMTGFTEGLCPPGAMFLHKPFGPNELRTAVDRLIHFKN
jgi:CheY-like chemotaxis protein